MSLFRSTGNSAEDEMSNAVGCITLSALGVIISLIAVVVLLVRYFA
jgi:hypothetical protein